MSVSEKDNKKTAGDKGTSTLIDPIYQKFTRGVLRAISSTDFYEFFMDSVSRAENEIQFSNRRLEKAVDLKWVDEIESTLPALQNIISSPRNVIREEELIVNAALAKRVGSDVVRHLSQHASFVEDYDDRTGDVRPTRVMQKYRDDTDELYENRLVFTTLEMAYHFVQIRHNALFESMSDEYGAKLKVNSKMETSTELVEMDMFLHIRETESAIETDERFSEVFNRVSRIYRLLATFMNTKFAQQMSKTARIKGNVIKTNVLKKNPNYRKVQHLLEFLRGYTDIGYSIRVIEQNPQINETFQRDIFHNIMFNYMILKGYLEDESERVIPGKPKEKRRALKPKFIREIIEELTEDYDLPDVEIRKVLIEELTKEQLMKEEAEERRRLVEEQQRKKKEEAERLRKEREAEKERIRQEKEAEKERIRQEKEAEKQRLFHERMMREAEDRRRSDIFRKQLERFERKKPAQLEAREKAWRKFQAEQQDFADAAMIIEEAERRKLEQQERERKRRQEEKERLEREKFLQQERIRLEKERRLEEARLAEERRQEQLRLEEERRQEQLRLEEERRQEQLRLEEERRQEQLRLEEEQRRAQQEREEREKQERELAQAMERLAGPMRELETFQSSLENRKKIRRVYIEQLQLEQQRLEEEKRQRKALRAAQVR